MKRIYLILGLLIGFSFASIAQGDDCGTAVAVTAPGTYTADGPSAGGGAINTDGSGNADWYSFTATCDGTIDVASCISGGTDTDLFIYEGNCPATVAENITNNGIVDDGCAGTFSSEALGVPVTAGTTYYIEWGDQWSTVAFDWNISFNLSGPGGLNVPAQTFSTADLDWADSGGSSWIVEWGPSGFTPGSGTILNVSTASDTTLTGLDPETTYEFYVSVTGPCAGTSAPFSFTTDPVCPSPAITATTPGNVTALFDWAENGTAVQWDVEYGIDGFLLGSGTQAYGVVLGTDTSVTGLNGSTDYDWYVRSVCDVESPFDTVSFWVGPIEFTTDQICADPNTLDTINSDPFGTDLTWLPGGLESEWNLQWGESGFPLSGVGANVINGNITGSETITGLTPGMTYDFYVQSVCGSSLDSVSLWVGPFTWTSPIFCTDPSNGGFANLTTTSVDFGWLVNGSETDWSVEYGLNGFVLGTGTMVSATNDTISVSGLNSETDYCFYVQANCGSTPDSSSNWVGPFCITTLTSCPLPTNLNAINITNSAANLIWQAGGSESSWNIEWGAPGFTAGIGEEAGFVNATSDNPYYVTGLNESAPYWYYVQAECGGGDTSQWAGPFQFFTQLVNDDACDAIKLNVDAPMVQHYNTGATSQVGEPVPGATGSCIDQDGWCVSGSGTTVWFSFAAPASGAVQITTFESTSTVTDGYTNIALYSVGDCSVFGSYVEEAANTLDIDAFGPPYGSTMTLCALNPGQEYYIMVDDLGFTLPNYFGIQVTSVDPAISAGTAAPLSVCAGDATPVDLFTAVTGNSTTDGQWYNPTVAPGNEFPNLLDFSGAPAGTYGFFYVDGSVCGADTVETSVTVEEGPNAGADGTVTSCNTTDVILVQELSGVVELGGTWSDDDATGALTNGVFNAFGVAAGTYTFTYTVASSTACPDATATVTVTLTDCLGLDTEVDNATLEVYPNPVEDILTVSNVNINTNFTIDIMDVQGKVVYTESYSGYNGNLEMNMNVVEDGVYIVRLTSEDSIKEVRVVKQ